MCRRNTVRERSLIFFLLRRGPFLWSSAMAGEHTRGADRSAWVTSGPHPFAWATSRSLQQISAFSPKLQTLYYLFKSHADIWISSSPTYFSVFGWLSELTYFRFFFPVICWSYLRTKISVILSIGNNLYSRHHISYFSFQRKQLCWCYLATALNLLSSSLPAKLVYYNIYIYIYIYIYIFKFSFDIRIRTSWLVAFSLALEVHTSLFFCHGSRNRYCLPGWKSRSRGKLKPISQEERIHPWKQHCKNLLGKSPQITDEPFTKIISNPWDIKLWQFTQKKLNVVQKH